MIDRHQAETRQILIWRRESRQRVTEYINKVMAARGDAAAKKLEDDSAEQWGRGNRGVWGDWR